MRTKRRINACNLIQKIGSQRGSSSIMIFFSFTVAALMMSMVIYDLDMIPFKAGVIPFLIFTPSIPALC